MGSSSAYFCSDIQGIVGENKAFIRATKDGKLEKKLHGRLNGC